MRKGTGLETSPSDSGRDIVANYPRTDVDQTVHLERWFVDCKHYQKGVPPRQLDNLLSWSQAERPDVALFISSGFLSNPSKDYIERYRENNKPAFKIKYWERPHLERITSKMRKLLDEYNLLPSKTRPLKDILAAEDEFMTKVWYGRKASADFYRKQGTPEDVIDGMLKAKAEAEQRFGKDALGPCNDFEWGMLSGKLSALRWVLGDDWDNLDT